MSEKLKFVSKDDIIDQPEPILKEWKVLVVDDERAVHDMVSRVLKDFVFDNGKLSFLHAFTGKDAELLASEHSDLALILLDVVMETDDAGLKCIKYIREKLKNDIIPIVLLTGQPGQAPEQSIIKNYSINDYQSKAELTSQRLNSIITVSLRAYQLSSSLRKEIIERKEIEKELISAKQMAEDANLSKTNFLSTMSHELRTPMNGILGVSNILLSTVVDPEEKYFLKIINDSGKALLNIIDEILDLTRLESNQIRLENVRINIKKIVNNLSNLFMPQIRLKKLDFNINIDDKIQSEYFGDLNRLNQILSQLLSNAIKFTESGSISLDIALIESETNKETVRFSIKDTGIGIPKEAFDNIFQSFTQIDGTKSRKFSGIGVGLTISEYLTTFMGGKLNLESEVGKGSRFWVDLPFRTQDNHSVEK